MIERRTVLRLLAGSVGTFFVPNQLFAQARLPRLALVDPGLPIERMAEGGQPVWDALFHGLRDLGHVEGETIAIERWTAAGAMDLGGWAQQIASTEPDIILCWGRFLIEALAGATTTIPIVGIGAFRSVVNYSRPGGNVTGIEPGGGIEALAKDLELLSMCVPTATRIGYLATQQSWDGPIGGVMRGAAGPLGLTMSAVTVEPPVSEATIRASFAGILRGALDALYIAPLGAFTPFDALIAGLALEHRLPAISGSREQAEAGLLLFYGPDEPKIFLRAAYFVHRILAGEDPGMIPIERAMISELVVNLRTAAALGLTLPPEIMLSATAFIN